MHLSQFHLPDDTLYERIVFCDFDGTITRQETFVEVLNHFSPRLAQEIIPRIYNREITLREGVRSIVQDIPANRLPDIIEFVRDKPIRKGFDKLLDFLAENGVPLVIISGGLLDIVNAVLGEYTAKIHAVYALKLDATGEKIQVISPVEDEFELVSKPSIMKLFNYKESVAIGDSITDVAMSLEADIVFARDRLAGYLLERSKPFFEWNNFVDVANHLKTLWNLYGRIN